LNLIYLELEVNIDVSLNGLDLEVGTDFSILPNGKIVLMRPKPKTEALLWRQILRFFVTGQWSELRPRPPYPDFVVIEDWSRGSREGFVFGTSEFNTKICYHEDL
jgi:hypothetical protein